MRWLIKDLAKVHPITRKYLTDATPPGGDYMRIGAKQSARRNSGNYIAIALFSDKHLIGWAMLDFFLSKNSPSVRTYIFVKPKYRRKGYGTKIMRKAREAAKRRGKNIRVCPWSKPSRKFFTSVNITKSEIAPGFTL
jgi:GNAT superfamily N-acetyltransferase